MRFDLQSKDVLAGLFFVVFGVLSLYLAADYPLGTLVHMGPGYFPTIIAWSIIALGIIIALRGFSPHSEILEDLPWRPLLFITAGLVIFGLLIDGVGLLIATLGLIVLSRLGGPDYRRFGEIAIQYVVLVVGVTALFVWALDLPMPIWPV